MSWLALLVAYVASAVPLLFDLDLAGGGEAPRLSLALFPWLALAGAPRCGRARLPPRPHLQIGAAVAAALPPLALAARLDVEAGFSRGAVLGAGGVGMLLCALAAAAAALARARHGGLHGVLWLALVACAPALALALALGGNGVPGWLERVARASPPVWALEASAGSAAGPLLVAAGLLLAAVRRGGPTA